jgi:hypothetical protein
LSDGEFIVEGFCFDICGFEIRIGGLGDSGLIGGDLVNKYIL